MATLKCSRPPLFVVLMLLTVALFGVSTLVDAAPIVNLSVSGKTGDPPFNPTFDTSGSTCLSPCSVHWDFGDGLTQDQDEDSFFVVSHIYDSGTYTAVVTLTDVNGQKASASVKISVTQGELFSNYVNTCEQQLGFNDADIPTNLNCTTGVLFAPNGIGGNPQTNDYMGYARVTDQVDLAFACRWVNNDTGGVNSFTAPPFVAAASIEMIIHNRQNGNTCFFDAKPRPMALLEQVPVAIVSPAVTARAAAGTPEANFWFSPLAVNNSLQCVDCHVEGPYIATPRIAPYLAQFGLLNNRHDTLGLSFDTNNNVVGNYHIIGSTFAQFNNIAASNNVTSTCANGCHSLGLKSTTGDFRLGIDVLLPALASVIDENDVGTPDISVTTSGVMPPYADSSDYRWINLDTPGDGVETENFANAKNASGTPVPQILSNCAAPGLMEAHVVGSENEFVVAQPGRFADLPDRLSMFNLKDGLVCLNSDQDPGQQCSDYSIRYECTDPSGNKTWTDWYNMDSPSGDGDHEERYKDANVCTSPANSVATGIEASVTLSNGWTYSAIGPNDRLASYSQYGLTCNNSDQPDGKCSNYVVRFSSCGSPPKIQYGKTLTNQYATGKQLTAASGSLVKGQGHNSGWNTQQWNIEPVANTEYVRIHNPGANVYLTVTSTAEAATVGTAVSNTSTNEMWLIEPVANSSDIRLKNLFSGRYLTMGDPNSFTSTPDYLPIFSQARNTGWTSQRWIVQ